jgi:3-oxoacyl-[acyl-carrier protein] reductase
MYDQMFSSKVAFLTAATSGIGLETARLLAKAGSETVIVNGRDPEAGARAVAQIKALAPACTVSFAAGDLCDLAVAGEVCRKVIADHGRVDVFVHAVGADISPRLFVDIDPADYARQIDGHFTALLNCSRIIVPSMVARRSGAVVVIASDAGKIATPGESIIGAMKAATVMFVRTLALEVSRHNVRVNCITPSLVGRTKAYDRVMAGEFSRRIFEKASAKARLGLPTPEHIAPLAVFLASELSSRTTGQAISVNGGISAA